MKTIIDPELIISINIKDKNGNKPTIKDLEQINAMTFPLKCQGEIIGTIKTYIDEMNTNYLMFSDIDGEYKFR